MYIFSHMHFYMGYFLVLTDKSIPIQKIVLMWMILWIWSTWEKSKIMQVINSYTLKIKHNIKYNKKIKCFSNRLKKTYVAGLWDNLPEGLGLGRRVQTLMLKHYV